MSTSSVHNNERTPLLSSNSARVSEDGTGTRQEIEVLGPMDIAPSTRRFILAGIWLGTFLTSLNMTLVATLVSPISSEYQAANQASWLGTAYLLATCTFTPLYGRLCDMMGRRAANQTAIGIAGLGTLCCGLSSSLPMLIASRFLGGIGCGGSFITAYVITSDMYSLRDRSLTQGIASIFNGAGQGLGGPLGGFISDRFGWRWAFLVQIPLYVTSFLLTGYNLNYVTPGQSKTRKETLKKIDYGGSILLLLSIGSFLAFLSFKYNDDMSLLTPKVIVSMICAIVTFLLFIIIELRVASAPILEPALLKMRVPVLVGTSNLLVSVSAFASVYFLPMYFETVLLTSTGTAGLHLLPNSVGMSVGSLFAGAVMSMTGRFKVLDTIFGLGPIISALLMSRLDENSGQLNQWLSIVPLGFGHAVILQTTFMALLAYVNPSIMAVATGFGQLWRSIGQVAGVAVPSAIFQHVLNRELTRRITGPGSDELIRRIRHSTKVVASLPPGVQILTREAYTIALRQVFWFVAALATIAFLVRLGIPNKSLDDPQDTTKPNRLDTREPVEDGERSVGDRQVAAEHSPEIQASRSQMVHPIPTNYDQELPDSESHEALQSRKISSSTSLS